MRTIHLHCYALLLLLVTTGAQAIVLIAAEIPPYVIRSQQGKPSGMAIDIMEEAARRLGEPLTIELMPLPRALSQTIHRKDVLLLPPARSSKREHLYYWITPLIDEHFLIVSDRRFYPEPLHAADLKPLNVGVLRHSFGQHLLTQRIGIAGETVANEQLNAEKLHRGRIDAWVAAWRVILYNQQQAQLSLHHLVQGEILMNTQLFLAANKAFSHKQAQRWQRVIEEMRKDGTLARLIHQYNYQAPE